MSLVKAGDLSAHYTLTGAEGAPVLVLSHSLGASLSMWDEQMPALERQFRVLRYDTRGHGRTAVTPAPYTLDLLAGDLLRMLDALQIGRVHFCGLSVGGLIGLWLGAHAGERLDKLVLCNTAARIGSVETWNARMDAVRAGGVAAISEAVMERWFTEGFRRQQPAAVARVRAMVEATPPEGYLGCCAAIRDADVRADLARVTAPTLVIAGTWDPATPPEQGLALSESITGALYVELPAAHLSNVEAADDFTRELIAFLAG
jgi:3-oxoadipate enol-lactonase